jgi:hypothetical protein
MSKDFQDRGIMSLEPVKYLALIASDPNEGFDNIIDTTWLLQEYAGKGSSTRSLCTFGSDNPDTLLHFSRVFISAFQLTIHDIRKPCKISADFADANGEPILCL